MFKVPLTYLFDFEHVTDTGRRFIMHEFAANGAKNLVLTDTLIRMIENEPKLFDTLREEMASEGLTFVDSHARFRKYYDLSFPEKAYRPRMIENQRLAIRMAADFGVDTICIHTGNSFEYPETPFEQLNENIIDSLDQLLPYAEQLGVTICIENIWSRLTSPDNLLYIKSKFPTDALGFTYDSGHANIMSDHGKAWEDGNARNAWAKANDGEPIWENQALEKMLPHVVNCHLHDNVGQKDMHVTPGVGNIDWNHIIPLLKKAPRLKNIQSEVIPARTNQAIKDICEAFTKLGEIE